MKNKIRLFLIPAFLGLLAISASVFSDTPPPASIFKLKAGSSTGIIQAVSGIIRAGTLPTLSIPYGASSGLLKTDSTNFFYNENQKVASSINFDTIAIDQNLFVATNGSDSNDCLTVSTPCLTIQGAVNKIPVVMGGVYQVNIAAGNYSSSSVIKLGERLSKSGDSTSKTVVKFVGASKATTTITQLSQATDMFDIRGASTVYEFDKITFSGGLRQVLVTGGIVRFLDVDFFNFFTSGLRATNYSFITLGTSNTQTINFTQDPVSSAVGSITPQTFSIINYTANLVFNSVRGGASSAISVGNNARIARAGGNITITTDATTPPRNPVLVSTYGSLIWGSTISITGPISTASGGHGGVRMLSYSFVQTSSNTTYNFTNLAKGFSIQPNAIYSESANDTYNFSSVTRPFELSNAAILQANTDGQPVYYVGSSTTGLDTNAYYGYDFRYAKVESETAIQATGVPFANTNSDVRLKTDSSNFYFDDTRKILFAKAFDSIAGATSNLYVATNGSDSNNCLTALTPCLTIQAALNKIPLIDGGIYQINVGAGTFTSASVMTLPQYMAKSGDSTASNIIKIVGAGRTSTTIAQSSSSVNIFNVKQKNTVVEFDGFTLSGGARQIDVEGGNALIKDVDFSNFFSSGVRATVNGIVLIAGGYGTRTFTPSSSSTTTSSLAVSSFGYLITECDMVFSGVRGAGSSAINVGTFGFLSRQGNLGVGNITITTAGTAPRFGVFIGAYGSALIGGGTGSTISITGPIGTSTAGYGAIRILPGGRLNFVAGQAFSFNSLNIAINIDSGAFYTEGGAGSTYAFNTVTTPVQIAHGAMVSVSSGFSGAAREYAASGSSGSVASAVFGYDDRYAMTARPTKTRTAVNDADYNVLATDALVSYTAISAPRSVVLPACASATTSAFITSGQTRMFTIKDEAGAAATHNLTVTVSGGATIDGSPNSVINSNYGSRTFYCVSGGTNYFTSE